MGGPGPAQFFFLLKEKLKKYFWNFTIFPFIFYVILINIKQYFYVAKKYKNPILKYPVFVKTSKIQKKLCKKEKKYFCAYGQVSQS